METLTETKNETPTTTAVCLPCEHGDHEQNWVKHDQQCGCPCHPWNRVTK